jgi:hypothetical protein
MRGKKSRALRKVTAEVVAKEFKSFGSVPETRNRLIKHLGVEPFVCRVNPFRMFKKQILESLKVIPKTKPILTRKEKKKFKLK